MFLRRSHPRFVSCNELFMGSSTVHVLGLRNLVVFSLPFGFTSCVINPTELTKKTKGGLAILEI